MNELNDSKFATRNWNIINDQSNGSYDVGSEIICKTEAYNDAYILVRGNITVTAALATQMSF